MAPALALAGRLLPAAQKPFGPAPAEPLKTEESGNGASNFYACNIRYFLSIMVWEAIGGNIREHQCSAQNLEDPERKSFFRPLD